MLALSPGFTFTPLFANGLKMSDVEIDGLKAQIAERAPAGRLAEPREIASAALFLASSNASYVNGAELTVDGGVQQI